MGVTRPEAQVIADVVEGIITDRRISKSELGRMADVSPQAAAAWFSKPVLITPEILNRIEDGFGMRHGWILAKAGYVDLDAAITVTEAAERDPLLNDKERAALRHLYEAFVG